MTRDKKQLKKMKKRIHKFNSYEFSTVEYVKKYYVENGVAVIKLDIPKVEDFFEPYSMEQPFLNSKVAEYIRTVDYYIPAYYPIEIRIVNHNFTEKEQELIRDTMIQYFGLVVGDKISDLNFNTMKSLVLLLVGIVVLGGFLILSYHEKNNLFLEIMSITGWFAIWEFVNAIWFERGHLHVDRMNAGQLATSTITFQEKGTKNKEN